MVNGLKYGVGLNADARNRGDAGIGEADAAVMVANKLWTSEAVVAAGVVSKKQSTGEMPCVVLSKEATETRDLESANSTPQGMLAGFCVQG